jgi:hypothetical protein
MKQSAIALLAVLAACSRPMSFVDYREPGGEFSVQVPEGWQIDERGPFSRKPVGEVWWVGETVDQHEGWPVGALLFIRRLDRNPGKGQERHVQHVLAETDALFSGGHPADVNVKAAEFSGYPARSFQRAFDETAGGGLHGSTRSHPSRVIGMAIQTPTAYYVLEYRATLKLFDKHLPAYERLTASFKLSKSPQ